MIKVQDLRDLFYIRWQWLQICRKLGISYDRAELNRLLTMYAEPQRHYHTIQHILECLRFIDKHFKYIPDVWLVKLAILYHDCVYEIGPRDNEAQSADHFKSWAADKRISTIYKNRVVEMILMTAGHKVEHDASLIMKVMSDTDMHIFLCPDHHYLEYARNIWREYGPFTDREGYLKGRLQFMKSLDPKAIFHMHQLRPFLHHARANIELEIDLLENHPDQLLVDLNPPS